MRKDANRRTIVSLAYAGAGRERLRNEGFEAEPESGEPVRFAWFERQHRVVADARFVDVRQIRQEKAEVHDRAPCAWLDA